MSPCFPEAGRLPATAVLPAAMAGEGLGIPSLGHTWWGTQKMESCLQIPSPM